jgi:hypothetical protein
MNHESIGEARDIGTFDEQTSNPKNTNPQPSTLILEQGAIPKTQKHKHQNNPKNTSTKTPNLVEGK